MVSPGKARRQRAFTLVEVMVAMTVLILVFVSSVSAITIGFRVMEDARMNTMASQILQSEMENIRLKNWLQIEDLQLNNGAFTVESSLGTDRFNQFSCTRTITDVNAELKNVEVALTWTSMDGRLHDRRYMTTVGKNGLNDYFYRSL